MSQTDYETAIAHFLRTKGRYALPDGLRGSDASDRGRGPPRRLP